MEDSFSYCRAYKDKVIFFGHIPTWKLYGYNWKNQKKDAKIWFDKTKIKLVLIVVVYLVDDWQQ